MKKIFTILTLLVFTSIFSQIPSYVPTTGLVGYWPFNGNANDISGNGNNGTVNGATLTTDRFGNANGAYSFNGYNNYIASTCSNLPLGNSSRSISAWVYMPSLNSNFLNFIASWGYGDAYRTSENKAFGFTATLNSMALWQSFGSLENNQIFNTSFAPNNYYHVVVTVDNIGLFKFYVNSILVYTNQIIGMNTISNANLLRFGRSTHTNTDGWAGYFLGQIDDIGIWNRALTQQEITGLYNTTNSSECQSLVINTGILSFNPVTYNNTVTIYPNPANDQITIDCGNIANVTGYKIKIVNTLGQEVFSGAMNTQQYVVPLNTWGGTGVYFVNIYDNANNLLNTKKIILQ